ncbi:hypothetical protein HMPREF3038_01609 [Akkermansia sp. KLE1797]|nr:hypothetical protein HMPREF3038_01609 [Akkermansia sp. KLE1797]
MYTQIFGCELINFFNKRNLFSPAMLSSAVMRLPKVRYSYKQDALGLRRKWK